MNLSNVLSSCASENVSGAAYLSIMYQNLDILESMMNDQVQPETELPEDEQESEEES